MQIDKNHPGYWDLTPQAQDVLAYMARNRENAYSISARDALLDLDIGQSSLTRRICDIRAAGYRINAERRRHPVTDRFYTRYFLRPGPGIEVGDRARAGGGTVHRPRVVA